MFTGLIEKKGTIQQLGQAPGGMTRLVLAPNDGNFSVQTGDSVAVDGCCLTVVGFDARTLAFDVSRETLQRTVLGRIGSGASVNLERALRVGDRLGGHWVLGHVDGIAQLEQVNPAGDGWELVVKIPAEFSRYLIAKGSICLNGVSLTINRLQDLGDCSKIFLMLIPKTLEITTFGTLKPGDSLNFEVDIAGKYFERFAVWQGQFSK